MEIKVPPLLSPRRVKTGAKTRDVPRLAESFGFVRLFPLRPPRTGQVQPLLHFPYLWMRLLPGQGHLSSAMNHRSPDIGPS